MSIGGNTEGLFQVREKGVKNSIGACETEWYNCISIHGWLDLSTGDSKHTTFNAKIQESTHIFLCDYQSLIGNITIDGQEKTVEVTSENARMIINSLVYDILLIDNPMNMNEQLEIYLRFIGGQ